MEKTDRKRKLQDKWFSFTIKKKIWFFTGVIFLIIFLSSLFDIWIINFFVNDFQVILKDNAKCSEFMDAIEIESICFAGYIKSPSEEKQNELEKACKRTSHAVSQLPYEYTSIGDKRYAKTWAIRNSYEVYRQKRDRVLKMGEDNPNYIKELYKVYDIQNFLQKYGRTLMADTLKEGTAVYVQKVPYIRRILTGVLLLGIILVCGMVSLTHLMNKTIILPIIHLADVSKKMASDDFFVQDVQAANQDEIGELIKAFNKMKDRMGQYIKMLEEKRKVTSLLHQEELEKLEAVRCLETAKFELLKNQINPHFLFNTLNVIGGMANLEDAKVTEKMTKALSSLFRYNLKTPEAEAAVAQELKIARDYMYLQQMRFGSRVRFQIECRVNADVVRIPTFSFQPIIENAIIHGLSKKEEGGKIFIRIWEKEGYVIISIADTGIGMTKEELKKLRQAFEQGETGQLGIGLGNIYKRVHMMYPGGQVEVFSKKNIGTAVRLKIPQMKREA